MIPFLNRVSELRRLRRAFESGERLVVLYGRRRLGKSRLLAEAAFGSGAVMFVADRRDARLQREAFAREVSALAPGFGDVVYPDWDILLAQLYRALPAGTVVAIDEFPYLVDMSPELPSLLQKHLDRRVAGPTVALCGSSQALMHGLVLDSTAPLFGRAAEILRVGPMTAPWLGRALGLVDPVAVVEQWAVWGGVPRYWELALGLDFWEAVADRILDPTGPLHDEPDRLLRDDLTDSTRASSILSLVGRGCHRLSEIAGRLGVPATDLARPIGKLATLGLLAREVPFGRTIKDSKRTLYRLADPFLAFWYRFVEPNRSRLEVGQVKRVLEDVRRDFPIYLGGAWEVLVRDAVPHLSLDQRQFGPAARWWGKTRTGAVELDVVADADAPDSTGRPVLVGEAKRHVELGDVPRLLADLRVRAAGVPELAGRELLPYLFVLDADAAVFALPGVVGPAQVLEAWLPAGA